MIFRILLLFILCSGTCIAQETTTRPNLKDTYTLPDDTSKVIQLLSLCTEYYNINHDTSLILANKALALSLKIQYSRGEVESLFRIGNEYFFLNHQQKALQYFDQTIAKAEIINAQYWIARSYRQMGSIKFTNHHIQEAVILNKKALTIHASMSDSVNLAQCYNRIGLFFMNKLEFDSSFSYIQIAIDINTALNNKRALSWSYRNLANLYLANKNFDLAETYYKKTISLQKEHSKKHEIILTAYKYAQLLIQQNNYSKAIYYLNHGITLAEDIRLLKNLPLLYFELSLAKELMGKHKDALKDYEVFISLSDSLQFLEEKILLKNKKSELGILQLNKSNAVLEHKKEEQFISNNNKKKLTIILIIALHVLVLLIINSIKKKDLIQEIAEKEKILTTQLIAKDVRNEQFNAINEITQNHEITKEQIARELHDGLGGTLAAIRMSLIQVKEDPIITDIIDSLAEISSNSRFISHDLHPPLLTSQTFCVIIQDYLNHIFNNTDLELSITMLPRAKINKLVLNTQITIYRIIQELCVNIKNHANAKKVSIQLLAHANDINLIIEDDGIGFTASNTTLKTNRGLILIKERLKIIDGEMEIDSKKNKGCTVYIFIPTPKQ